MPRIPLTAALLLAVAPTFAQTAPAPTPSRSASAPHRAHKEFTVEDAKRRAVKRFERMDTDDSGTVSREEARQFREQARAKHPARFGERMKRSPHEPIEPTRP